MSFLEHYMLFRTTEILKSLTKSFFIDFLLLLLLTEKSLLGGRKVWGVDNVLSAKETAKQMTAGDREVSNSSHRALNTAHLTSKIFVGICLFTVPMPFYNFFTVGTFLTCEFKSSLHAKAQLPYE